MIFSVYDYDRGRYRYFEGIGGTPATGFFRKANQAPTNGGFVPESFAVRLPAGVKLVGEGPLPRGYIAQDPSGLSAAPIPGEGGAPASTFGSWWMLALVATVAFVAGRASRRGS